MELQLPEANLRQPKCPPEKGAATVQSALVEALDKIYFGHEHPAPNLVAQHTLLGGVHLHLASFGSGSSKVGSREATRLALACIQATAEDPQQLISLLERCGTVRAFTPSAGAQGYLERVLNKVAERSGEAVQRCESADAVTLSTGGLVLRIKPHRASLRERFFYALGRLLDRNIPPGKNWRCIEIAPSAEYLEKPPRKFSGLSLLSASMRLATVAVAGFSAHTFAQEAATLGFSGANTLLLAGLAGSSGLGMICLAAAKHVRATERHVAGVIFKRRREAADLRSR